MDDAARELIEFLCKLTHDAKKLGIGFKELSEIGNDVLSALSTEYFTRTIVRKYTGIDVSRDYVIGSETDPLGTIFSYIAETAHLPGRGNFEAMDPGKYNDFVKNFPEATLPSRACLLFDRMEAQGKRNMKTVSEEIAGHMNDRTQKVIKKAEYSNFSDLKYPADVPEKVVIGDVEGWAGALHLYSVLMADTFKRYLE